jgi:hypothetical protein
VWPESAVPPSWPESAELSAGPDPASGGPPSATPCWFVSLDEHAAASHAKAHVASNARSERDAKFDWTMRPSPSREVRFTPTCRPQPATAVPRSRSVRIDSILARAFAKAHERRATSRAGAPRKPAKQMVGSTRLAIPRARHAPPKTTRPATVERTRSPKWRISSRRAPVSGPSSMPAAFSRTSSKLFAPHSTTSTAG